MYAVTLLGSERTWAEKEVPMTYAGLNTICPVCGAQVPEDMPPMEVVHTSHLDDRGIPMLRVCCHACALRVHEEPDLYYRAARMNTQAKPGTP